MIVPRPALARGHTHIDWLDSRHTFSFGGYFDANHMGFGPLRVINDDRIAPGGGFATHGHRDMEIITYVLSGALEHKDSLGTGSVIVPGEVQRMSAGRGIRHSEFNASQTEPVHLLQIWIEPAVEGVAPSYAQADFSSRRAPGKLTTLVTPDGADGTLAIHQDARMQVLDLAAGGRFEYHEAADRGYWVHVARGGVRLNGVTLEEGAGAAVGGEPLLRFEADVPTEVLFFDLPMRAA